MRGRRLRPYFILFAFVLAVLSPPVYADDPVIPQSYTCTFKTGVNASFKAGKAEAKITKKFLGDKSVVVFDRIDPRAGAARVIRGVETENITMFMTDRLPTFLERVYNGGIIFTTVYPKAMDGRIYAVRSTHLDRIGIEPLPGQGYGVCEAKE